MILMVNAGLQLQQLSEDEALAQAIAASLADVPAPSTASTSQSPSAAASHIRTDSHATTFAHPPSETSRQHQANGASTSAVRHSANKCKKISLPM